jgi:hypothetical protein
MRRSFVLSFSNSVIIPWFELFVIWLTLLAAEFYKGRKDSRMTTSSNLTSNSPRPELEGTTSRMATPKVSVGLRFPLQNTSCLRTRPPLKRDVLAQ